MSITLKTFIIGMDILNKLNKLVKYNTGASNEDIY